LVLWVTSSFLFFVSFLGHSPLHSGETNASHTAIFFWALITARTKLYRSPSDHTANSLGH
jgi:hypothetical protein